MQSVSWSPTMKKFSKMRVLENIWYSDRLTHFCLRVVLPPGLRCISVTVEYFIILWWLNLERS